MRLLLHYNVAQWVIDHFGKQLLCGKQTYPDGRVMHGFFFGKSSLTMGRKDWKALKNGPLDERQIVLATMLTQLFLKVQE